MRKLLSYTLALLVFCGWFGAAAFGAFDYARLFPTPKNTKARGVDNSGSVPSSVVACDLNRDGHPDLAVAYAFSDQVRWFFGDAAGQFTLGGAIDVGTKNGTQNDAPRQLITGDFNEDGFTDLLVVCSGLPPESGFPAFLLNAPSVGVLYGRPGGFYPYSTLVSFGGSPGSAPDFALHAALGTFDSHDEGLAVGFANSKQVGIREHAFSHNGHDFFDNLQLQSVSTTGTGPYSVLAADLNNDELSELILIDEKDVQVWRNGNNATFPQRTKLANGSGFTAGALADFNNDGQLDLAVADGAADLIRIYLGLTASGTASSSLTLQLAPGSGPVDLKVCDANLDGHDDLAVACLTGSPGGHVFLNHLATGGGFTAATDLTGALNPRALEAVDISGDHLPDFILANEGDKSVGGNEDVTFTINTLPLAPGNSMALDAPLGPGPQVPPNLDRPTGLAWDATRRALWTIDRGTQNLICLTTAGTVLSTTSIASLGAGLIDPRDVTVDSGGQLWLSDGAALKLVHYQPGGAVTGSISINSSDLARPSGIAFDAAQNRLFVSDALNERVVSYSVAGAKLKSYSTDDPIADLAWDFASQTLWSVSTDGDHGNEIVEYQVDESHNELDKHDELEIDDCCPALNGARISSIAVDPATGFLHLLSSAGAWALINPGGGTQLVASREWRLLREVSAILKLQDGTLLAGDGGLFGTLVHLAANGQVISTWPLTTGGRDGGFAVRGLAEGLGKYFVLDAAQHVIQAYDPDGTPRGTIGMNQISGNDDVGGLLFDSATNTLSAGGVGRLYQFTLSLQGGNVQSVQAPSRMIPALHIPDSLCVGPHLGDIAVFCSDENVISILNAQGNVSQVINRFPMGTPGFIPRSIWLPSTVGATGYIAGSGPNSLISFTLESFKSAVQTWNSYQ